MASKGRMFAGCTVALVTPFRDGESTTRRYSGRSTGRLTREHPSSVQPARPASAHLDPCRARTGDRSRGRAHRGEGPSAGWHRFLLNGRGDPPDPVRRRGRGRRGTGRCPLLQPAHAGGTLRPLHPHRRRQPAAPGIYNVPSRTACHLEPETIERLAHHERIVAIKEASGSLDQASDILARTELTVSRVTTASPCQCSPSGLKVSSRSWPTWSRKR